MQVRVQQLQAHQQPQLKTELPLVLRRLPKSEQQNDMLS